MIRVIGDPRSVEAQEWQEIFEYMRATTGWAPGELHEAIHVVQICGARRCEIKTIRAFMLSIEQINYVRAAELQLLFAWCLRESGDYYLTTWLAEDEQGKCCSPYQQQADVRATLGIAERIPQNKRGAPHGSRRAVRLGCLPEMEFSERRGGELLHKRRVRVALLRGVSWPCSHEVVKWVESRTYFDAHPELPCDLADTGMVPFRVPANRNEVPPLNPTQPSLTHGGTYDLQH